MVWIDVISHLGGKRRAGDEGQHGNRQCILHLGSPGRPYRVPVPGQGERAERSVSVWGLSDPLSLGERVDRCEGAARKGSRSPYWQGLSNGCDGSRTCLQAQRTGNHVVGDFPVMYVESRGQPAVPLQGCLPTQVGKCTNIGQSRVG